MPLHQAWKMLGVVAEASFDLSSDALLRQVQRAMDTFCCLWPEKGNSLLAYVGLEA